MARYVDEQGDTENAFELVNDYQSPGELISAHDAHYLISIEIPSPMGAFLSAFSTKEKVSETQSMKGGEIYNWNKIKSQFKREHVERIGERPQ
jgi:copper chaperone NosL